MTFLDQSPGFLLFAGDACATEVQLADAGKRVLLVSTDPASKVRHVLSIRIGNQATAVAEVPGLFALEIDPQAAAPTYHDRIVGPVRGVSPVEPAGVERLLQLSGHSIAQADVASPELA